MTEPTQMVKTIQASMRSLAPNQKTDLSKKQSSSKSVTKIAENNITTHDIGAAITALNKDLQQTQNAYKTQKDNSQQYANQFTFLNPLDTGTDKNESKKQNDKNTEKLNVDELLKQDADTLKKSIELLKKNPELMQDYLKKKQQQQKEEKKLEQNEAFNKRVKRQQEAVKLIQKTHPEYVAKPLTKDFNQKIQSQIKNHEFTEERRKAKIVYKSLQITNKANIIQKQMMDRQNEKYKRHLLNMKRINAQTHQMMLPLTYIQQKNSLLSFIKLTSILTLLRNTSSVFSEINASNKLIERSCITIQQYMRMYNRKSIFQNQLKTIQKCQISTKLFLNKKRYQQRILSLQKIREMLFQQYNNQTFLGSVQIIKKNARDLLLQLIKSRQKKLVRKAMFHEKLESADRENAATYVRLYFYNKMLAEINNKTRGRPKKPLTVEDVTVTDEDVGRHTLASNTLLVGQLHELLYKRLFQLKENVILDQYGNDVRFQQVEQCCFTIDYDMCKEIVAKVHSLNENDPKKERNVEAYIVDDQWPKVQEFRAWLQEVNFD